MSGMIDAFPFVNRSVAIPLFSYFFSDNLDAELLQNSFQSLNDGLCIVLGNVFNCNRFAVELLINFHDDHIRVCLEIMKQLLQSSTTDNPHYLSCVNIEQKNVVHHMLGVCVPTGKCRLKYRLFLGEKLSFLILIDKKMFLQRWSICTRR